MVLTKKRAAEMMLRIGKRNNKGFLLLEALVSVAILSVALVMILNSFMRSIRATELSEDYFRAGLLLEEKFFELYARGIKEGSSGDTFGVFDNRFSWDLDVIRLDEDRVREVSLGVSWNQGSKEYSTFLLTYL